MIEILKLVEDYKAVGGVAHVYPRKKAVAINGFPAIPYSAAKPSLAKMIAARLKEMADLEAKGIVI